MISSQASEATQSFDESRCIDRGRSSTRVRRKRVSATARSGNSQKKSKQPTIWEGVSPKRYTIRQAADEPVFEAREHDGATQILLQCKAPSLSLPWLRKKPFV